MGRDQNARHAKQRRLGAGLFLKHIEGNARDHPALQPREQGLFVIDAATGTVHHPHARLEDLQRRSIDQMPRLVGQWRVHG